MIALKGLEFPFFFLFSRHFFSFAFSRIRMVDFHSLSPPPIFSRLRKGDDGGRSHCIASH